MRVAIATYSAMPPGFDDDERLVAALGALGVDAEQIPWDDSSTDWRRFDAVVIRSTWDYVSRIDDFLRWVDSVGDRLHNTPALIRWNADKRYLGELAAAGIPVVETTFVSPGAVPPPLVGEVVVKPSVSAGAADSGRFGASAYPDAVDLIDTIHASGRTAMVQPYLSSVDRHGETAVVCIDGAPLHVLRKRAVLRPDEVAPMRPGGVAEVMYEDDLVAAGEATAAELELAGLLLDHVADRFGYVPLYARVDLVADEAGNPVLMELEAVEPALYLDRAPGSVERVAAAIVARVGG
jgi:hypothetical protein